ncbi:hypothetical protein HCN44_005373 [Aphidius gifuensis]|uniref:cholesterol 7-desaturase n=1 Tax=Aphidius gifuensis TaxID=684658 RepID=A0A834Y5Z2_APHGI|nr:hypothetical protein HCN44_005373 [Aphidius gifuensis]
MAAAWNQRKTHWGLDKNLNKHKRKIGELPPVYPNGWFALLESYQLAKEQVKHIAVLGENFAVFRTKNGDVKIIDAYCPHLGANMAEGGRIIDDCLECPFHNWTFRGDGECQSIPYAEKIPPLARTRAWKSCEINNIIFVWYHAELANPDWMPMSLEKISSGNWWYHGRNEYLINCHIQEIPENGADIAHLNAVHGPAMIISKIFPSFARHSWSGASWSLKNHEFNENKTSAGININTYDNITDKHRAIVTLNHSFSIFEKYSILCLKIRGEQIGPGYVELFLETSIGTVCILQTVTPIDKLVQRVVHMIYSPPLLGPYARVIFIGECLMFQRDVNVWNKKKFQKRPTLVREDKTIISFRKWYSQFYSENSPTYNSVKSLDW